MSHGTLGDRMVAVRASRGFDYMRIILAAGVVAWHSVSVSGDQDAMRWVLAGPLGPLKALILPMFFSLSGFLVAGSLERSQTLEGFLTLRALRIMPALAVEVLLSAFFLGAALTTLPLTQYFTSPTFAIYLRNLVGDIHYALPGVFIHNPDRGTVNRSLWTVPFELICYATLTVLALFRIDRHRRLFVAATGLLMIGLWAYYLLTYHHGLPGGGWLTMPGPGLIISFLAGISLRLNKDRIPLRAWIAFAAAVVACALIVHQKTMILATVPAAYLTVWLGLTNPPPLPLLSKGDYSYGLYLFAYPIQQSLAMTTLLRPWYANLPAALVLGLIYAAFSWHFVEKPIDDRKKKVVAIVERAAAYMRRLLNIRRREAELPLN